MKELKCPHCGKTFTVDESEYASLLSQVKTAEFDKELKSRIAEMHRLQEAQQKADEAAHKSAIALAVAQKENEMNKLFASKEQTLKDQIADAQKEMLEKESRLKDSENVKRLAVIEAENKLKDELQKQKEDAAKELQQKEKLIQELETNSKIEDNAVQLRIKNIEEQYKKQLEMKDEVIAQYKDFKTRLSTKMIGESLEVYCHNQYDTMVRPYIPGAYFEKDNDVVEGTKGDFVFRDMVDGVESVSIMFEMKNEADLTATKHKNSDFFDKLDSDRKKKKCEYAVLVTMLELDNDLYNNGIFAVPNQEKMFVVRPQQFLTIISILVQTGRNTVKVKQELENARNREIDVTKFEDKVAEAKRLFDGHVKNAADRYNEAINDIDKAITQLQNTKEQLRLWVSHLHDADGNLEDLSIRKLTYKNPTMKAKFDEARQNAAAQIEEIKD